MPTATYEPIATQTLTNNATSIVFSSIPNTYTDLVLVSQAFAAVASINLFINSGKNINVGTRGGQFAEGFGAADLSVTGQTANHIGWAYTVRQGGPAIGISHFMNYANTNMYKQIMGYDGQPTNNTSPQRWVEHWVSMFLSTSAIDYIELFAGNNGTFNTGYTATLYGIKAA